MRSRWWRRWLLGVPVALFVAFLALRGHPGAVVAQDGVAVSSALLILLSVWCGRPARRAPWLLLAAGELLWATGDVVYALIGGDPSFSAADVCYVGGYVALLGGLVLLVRSRTGDRDVDALIDASAAFAAAMVVVCQFVVGPGLAVAGVGLAARATTALYPILDIALLALIVRLLMSPGKRPKALWALIASIAVTGIGDLFYAWQTEAGAYVTGASAFLDSTWLAGYVLMAVVATSGSFDEVSEPGRRQDASRTRAAVVIGAVVVLPAVAPLAALLGEELEPLSMAIGGATLTALVVWRVLRILGASDRAERRLALQEEHFRAMVSNSSDASILLDRLGRVIEASAALEGLLGHRAEGFIGQDALSLVHADDLSTVLPLFDPATLAEEGAGRTRLEVRLRHADGTWRWMEVRATNLLREPTVAGLVVNLHDITDRKQAERALAHQAFHDTLTGLANRSLLRDRLERALANRRRTDTDVAVIFCDLDGFKTVNDSMGHDAGDQLLRVVSHRLLQSVRGEDTVARLGGDEFAVLLEGRRALEDATSVTERILESLSAPILVGPALITVGVSAGIALASQGIGAADELLRNADVAMYTAKAAGKQCFRLYADGMREAAMRRNELERELRQAVHGGELRVHYQPVMALGEHRLVGFEALVRWQHPEHGLLPPDVFIPLAEETGLIGAVGRWVLQEACVTAQGWALTEGGEHLAIGVNVSARQLDDPDFVAHVGLALAASGLAPASLVLELSEAVLAGDAAVPLARFAELRALGVRIAIDDVGTSYTSLAQLSELPVDIMKIDRAFVAAIDDGPRLPAIVKGLLGFGQTINVETVAAGIELESQHQLLRREGCDLGQGFLFARPLEPADATALVGEHHRAGTLGGALSPAA